MLPNKFNVFDCAAHDLLRVQPGETDRKRWEMQPARFFTGASQSRRRLWSDACWKTIMLGRNSSRYESSPIVILLLCF